MSTAAEKNFLDKETMDIYSVYQPIYFLEKMQIIGYEALIRSKTASPKELFEKAQKLGRSIEFDIECINRAILNISKINGLLFLNVRPSTLMWLYKNNYRKLTVKLPKDRVILEITEIEEILDIKGFIKVLKNLKKNGCKYSADDIASGFNRLQLVMDTNPDYIKLDGPIIKSCYRYPNKRSAIKHLTALGKDIGSIVIAENIENNSELQTVKELGVPYAQGFYLGKPSAEI